MTLGLILFHWLTARARGIVAVVHGGTLSGWSKPSSLAAAASAAPLRWRGPWWAWQGLSLVAGTVLAPTFWITGILLLVDAHSDHPVFWPSLMASVAIGNVAAIMYVNQLHHRRPFTQRMPVALRHAGASMSVGGTLFLLLGWSTGFLQDFFIPIFGAGANDPALLLRLSGMAAAALAFGILSFAHAGVLHAWLGFRIPYREWERPSAEKRDDSVRD